MPSPPGPGRSRHRASAQRDRVNLGVADRERDDNLFQTLTQPQHGCRELQGTVSRLCSQEGRCGEGQRRGGDPLDEGERGQTLADLELGGAESQRQQAEGGFGDGGGVALRPCVPADRGRGTALGLSIGTAQACAPGLAQPPAQGHPPCSGAHSAGEGSGRQQGAEAIRGDFRRGARNPQSLLPVYPRRKH